MARVLPMCQDFMISGRGVIFEEGNDQAHKSWIIQAYMMKPEEFSHFKAAMVELAAT